ncbi:MAG: curli assembly protein CsgG [Hyphomicrobiales bacterium]|nr:MAG: curli assembly protein CsgG [Hyphomicrobiales bacterium]
MKHIVLAATLGAFLTAGTAAAMAAPLVYTPINPSFGGNPLNSSHLMGLASAQRTATAFDAKKDGDGGTDPGTTPGSSDAELFIRQLQGRLLSALASQVTEAIFGENGAPSGEIVFDGTIIKFNKTLSAIELEITDETGTTVISVPRLQIN